METATTAAITTFIFKKLFKVRPVSKSKPLVIVGTGLSTGQMPFLLPTASWH